MHTVCIRYFWQGNPQIYGHIRCIYTVLANPTTVTKCNTPVFLRSVLRLVLSVVSGQEQCGKV